MAQLDAPDCTYLEIAGLGEVDPDNVDMVLHGGLLPCQSEGAHPVEKIPNDDVATQDDKMHSDAKLVCLMESARNQNLGPTSGSLC